MLPIEVSLFTRSRHIETDQWQVHSFKGLLSCRYIFHPGHRNLNPSNGVIPGWTSYNNNEMFDLQLRSLKDRVFDPLCQYVPAAISPGHVTLAAFLTGLISCGLSAFGLNVWAVIFWFFNRSLDCLDGALARHRHVASDVGGFLDLLGDFVVYSLIPIATAFGSDDTLSAWRAVAFLESTFHVNNFILFYVAAITEKLKSDPRRKKEAAHITSVVMRPALIEGMESAVLFTAMLLCPWLTGPLALFMGSLVCVGIIQRTLWAISTI